MKYPFQFSTVMLLFAGHISGSPVQEELFYGIFDGIVATIDAKEMATPEKSSISRWISGNRNPPKALKNRCQRHDARRVIERDIRKNILPKVENPQKLIYSMIRLLREDETVDSTLRNSLIDYTPALESNHADFMAQIVILALCENKHLDFDQETFLKEIKGHPDDNSLAGRTAPIIGPFFLGREKELKEIDELIKEKKVVFLYGPRGIGKSAIAIIYAKRTTAFRQVIWATYMGTLHQTIESIAFSRNYRGEECQQLFDRNFLWLKAQGPETLIVLDNFDELDENEELLGDFVNCGCSILVTSHVHHEIGYEYTVSEMSQEELRTLFYYHYVRKDICEEEVDEVIEAAYNHTMIVEMTAKLMRTSMIPQKTVVHELRKSVGDLNLPVNVLLSKDGKFKNTVISAHVKALYDMSSLTDKQLRTLVLLSYMPIDGTRTRYFSKWCGDTYSITITELSRMGWVDRYWEKDIVKQHPLVSEILRSKRSGYEEDIIAFAQRVVKGIKDNRNVDPDNALQVSLSLKDHVCDFDSVSWAVAQFDNAVNLQALGHKNTALAYMKQITGQEHAESYSNYFLAYAHYNIGRLLVEMACYDEALQHFEQALSYKAGKDFNQLSYRLLLANCLLECALVFAVQNNSRISSRFMLFLMSFNNILPDEEWKILNSRMLYKQGEILRIQGKYEAALEVFNQSLILREDQYHPSSEEAALAHAQIGLTYRKMGDNVNAVQEYHTACSLLEKRLPAMHPSLISVQLSLGIALEEITNIDLGIARLLDYLAGVEMPEDPNSFVAALSQNVEKLLEDVVTLQEKEEQTGLQKDMLQSSGNIIKRLFLKLCNNKAKQASKEFGWKQYHFEPNYDPRSFSAEGYGNGKTDWVNTAEMRLRDYHVKQTLSHEIFHSAPDIYRFPNEISPNCPAREINLIFAKECGVYDIPELECDNTLWYMILCSPLLPLPKLIAETEQ